MIDCPLDVGIGQFTAGDHLSSLPKPHTGCLTQRVSCPLQCLGNLALQSFWPPATGHTLADNLGDLITKPGSLAFHKSGGGLACRTNSERVGPSKLGTSTGHDALQCRCSLTPYGQRLDQIGGEPALPGCDLLRRKELLSIPKDCSVFRGCLG